MDKEISFCMPNGTIIKVQNCNCMTFSQVMQYFREKCFYFSKTCIRNNLHIMISGQEISRDKYPFSFTEAGSIAEIVLTGKTVTIEYTGKVFIFSENEYAYEARNFIFQAFPEIEFDSNLSIFNDFTKKVVTKTYELKSNEKYSIRANFSYIFENISKITHVCIQRMDYFSKVSDAKQLFASLFSDNHQLKPENIKIFDSHRQEITDDNKFLKDVNGTNAMFFAIDYDSSSKKAVYNNSPQNERKFTKSIDDHSKASNHQTSELTNNKLKREKNPSKIESEEKERKEEKHSKKEHHKKDKETTKDSIVKIHFVFEGSKEEEDSSFDEYFDLNTTVEEIEDKLKRKIDKEDKITLEYEDREDGEKIILGRKMKIINILDDIKTETKKGQPIYILYIKIKKPTKSTKPIKPKIIKTADSSSDSDSKRKPKAQSKSSKQKDISTKNSSSNDCSKNDDDDDDDVSIEHKRSKAKSKDKSHSPSNPTKQKLAIKNEKKSGKCKYYYQTNREDKIEEIELDAGTSVKEMKQIIAKNNGVDSLSNIKVIFAGKDLLNELILDDLEIGDIPLYVYIRSDEDILLMTAKALVIKKEDLDLIEEEEETE